MPMTPDIVTFLNICLFFHCLHSSDSKHNGIGTEKAANPTANDLKPNIKFSDYLEENLPTNIIRPPSADCVEEEVISVEGQIAVENKGGIGIDDGIASDEKNIKQLKTKRPCKTRHDKQQDKRRSAEGPDENSLERLIGIVASSVIVSSFVVLVVVAVVVRYRYRLMASKVSVDAEKGTCKGQALYEVLAANNVPGSSLQSILQAGSQNAHNAEPTKAVAQRPVARTTTIPSFTRITQGDGPSGRSVSLLCLLHSSEPGLAENIRALSTNLLDIANRCEPPSKLDTSCQFDV